MAFPRPDDNEKQDKIRAQEQRWRNVITMVILAIMFTVGLYLALETNPTNDPPLHSSSSVAATSSEDIHELEKIYNDLDAQTRKIKATQVIMETDPESKRVTKRLQEAAQKLLKARYGDHESYRVQLDLEFQKSIPDFDTKGKDGVVVFEMAPIDLIPVSVFTFLEVARTWKRGSFHRNAGHVLQAQVECDVTQSLPFQEYSPQHPHKKGTVGYCGRPSGPCFYISIMDNTVNHGPGSQQKHNPYEADANFGRVVQGMEDVVPRIHSTPQKEWLDKDKQIFIRKMHILIPNGSGGYKEWREEAV